MNTHEVPEPILNSPFAEPEKAHLEFGFPRVEGYTQGIRHRVTADWDSVAPLRLVPMHIPSEVKVKAGEPSNAGCPALSTRRQCRRWLRPVALRRDFRDEQTRGPGHAIDRMRRFV